MKYFKKFFVISLALGVIFFVSNFVDNNVVSASAKVNINTADATELDTIPEVGPATAAKIIAYREANGPFATIEGIMNVSGIKQATFDKIKDYITVGDDSGADDNNNNDDEGTATTTATTTDITTGTTATTTATSTATTTANTDTVSTVVSVHYIQEDLSDYVEPTTFEVSVGRDRLSYIDSPVNFVAKYKVSSDLSGRRCNYLWNFGDGISQTGEKIEHIYKYVGDYNVVLNGTCGDLYSVSRTKVKIEVPNLSITRNNDNSVIIANQGEYEINLFGWKLQSGNKKYSFPLDTIISAGQSVTFPAEYLKFSASDGEIILVDASGKEVTRGGMGLSASNSDKIITLADFQKFAVEYKRLIQPKVASANVVAVSNLSVVTVLNTSESSETESDIPLTASVGTARGGFWSVIFHPIRTIQEAFYK